MAEREEGTCYEAYEQNPNFINSKYCSDIQLNNLESKIKYYIEKNPCTSICELALILGVNEQQVEEVSKEKGLNLLFV